MFHYHFRSRKRRKLPYCSTCRGPSWCPPCCPPCRSAGTPSVAHHCYISSLTGFIWCRSQVSRMQSDNFFPVKNSLTLEEVRTFLTRPGEEKNWFDSRTSTIGHIVTYLEEESASEHQEGPLGTPSTWPLFTISLCKITKKCRQQCCGYAPLLWAREWL